MATYDELLKDFEKREASAREANIKRRGQVESIFDEIIARYGPEGSFGAGMEETLRRAKVHDVAKAESSDLSRGMFRLGQRGAEWEATTGYKGRLKLEDIKMERLSQAQTGKAGFLESINDPYPDYGTLFAAAQAEGSAGGGGGGYTPTGGGGGGGVSASSGGGLMARYQSSSAAIRASRPTGITSVSGRGDGTATSTGEIPKWAMQWYRAGLTQDQFAAAGGDPNATISKDSAEWKMLQRGGGGGGSLSQSVFAKKKPTYQQALQSMNPWL